MGWKTLKERFQIGHIVCVTDKGVCIGSPYIHDIIVIGADGTITKRYADQGYCATNEDLVRYQKEMDADPEAVRTALAATDRFEQSLAVWTYEGGEIIEKQCETYGWPNITHDGDLMYDNRHSADRAKVLEWAKSNAEAGRRFAIEQIEKAEKELAEAKGWLAESDAEIAKLAAV